MSDQHNEYTVTHNEGGQRYEVTIGHDIAVLEYQLASHEITLTHTEVPQVLEGRGIAAKLVKAALEEAQSQGRNVIPRCPFVASYIHRHADYQSLVPPQYKHLVKKD
ncbi:MAG: GNAT family N-acetyltransferase [Herpetosiphon sp.]